ncbi:hypothetical protein GCM10023403_10750 [Pseudonocardia benzenivorans]|uniref:hypothetical protein n=1 Tax=Pseudonocardia benzenivorans TaxID=228005 RepID=UPI0031FA21F4
MTAQPDQPTGVPAQAVVDELSRLHADHTARLTAELAQARVLIAQQAEELRYLRSIVPAEQAAD